MKNEKRKKGKKKSVFDKKENGKVKKNGKNGRAPLTPVRNCGSYGRELNKAARVKKAE